MKAFNFCRTMSVRLKEHENSLKMFLSLLTLLFCSSVLANASTLPSIPSSVTDVNLPTHLRATECFSHCSPKSPRYPTTFRDCIALISTQISVADPRSMDSPRTWGRNTTADITTPFIKIEGSCAVVVDVPDSMVFATTSIKNVAITAQEVAKKCVIPEPNYGGEKWIGWNGEMIVTVFGRKGSRIPVPEELSASCTNNEVVLNNID